MSSGTETTQQPLVSCGDDDDEDSVLIVPDGGGETDVAATIGTTAPAAAANTPQKPSQNSDSMPHAENASPQQSIAVVPDTESAAAVPEATTTTTSATSSSSTERVPVNQGSASTLNKFARLPPKERNLTPLERKERFPFLNILKNSSMEEFAAYLKEKKCKKIIVMTGAGISTSAGIPDFRSPGTGLYDNLQKYGLPYPEAVFDIRYFRYRPEPFFTLAKELYPGSFKPTTCHYFIRILAQHSLLHRCYTQNIDTLERVAGIPENLLVEAHGSFATASCVGRVILDPNVEVPLSDDWDDEIASMQRQQPVMTPSCGRDYSQHWVRKQILADKIPACDTCDGVVKPNITFFGENLPSRFYDLFIDDFRTADALVVIGTSLKVNPFASLISRVGEKVPRLLINREEVGLAQSIGGSGFDFTGEFAEYRRDAVFLGDCDAGCKRLAELMGFSSELENLIEAEHRSIDLKTISAGAAGLEVPHSSDVRPVSPVGVSAIDAMLGDALRDLSITDSPTSSNRGCGGL